MGLTDQWSFQSCLPLVESGKFMKSLSTFRTSAHDLMVEKGSHLGIERYLRYCLFGNNDVKGELRLKYIPQKLYMHPNLNTFQY